MENRIRNIKIRYALLILVVLTRIPGIQTNLNKQRETLGLTRGVPALENAPPVLMFTTVALGGFRGIISNMLWIRANDMQEQGKYFEAVQLADWITKLQPNIVTVWVHQAWNMAYNISVKFPDHKDRYTWVMRAVSLLRDQAIKYNPKEPLLYRELGWIFQHKMGSYLDDATETYKENWAKEMNAVFGRKNANFDELISPQTEEQKERAKVLRDKYKLDPAIMKEVDKKYGPLEWRLPEAHAIYWGYYGLEKVSDQALKKDDFITLRRLIFQSLQTAFHRGRIIYPTPDSDMFLYGPNLDIVKHVSDAYLEQAALEPDKGQHILTGHRNFLTTAVYFLYSYRRLEAAKEWYAYVTSKYPDVPEYKGKTMEEYAFSRVQDEVGSTDPNRIRAVIEGYLEQYFIDLAIGEEDHAEMMGDKVQKIYKRYMEAIGPKSVDRVGLMRLDDTKLMVAKRLVSPQYGLNPQIRAQLLTRLGKMPGFGADIWTNAPDISLNAVTAGSVTNQIMNTNRLANTNSTATNAAATANAR